jgi:transposase
VAHADARTTVYARKLIVDRVLAGHRPGVVAEQPGVSRQTVYKWVRRWRAEGEAGLVDRSSRPHGCPAERHRSGLRRSWLRQHRAGPVRLAALLGIAALLTDVDRLTGQLVRGRWYSDRRYERERPGDLLHVDVGCSAGCPMAAAGACMAAGRRSVAAASAGISCTSPSTTTPGRSTPDAAR